MSFSSHVTVFLFYYQFQPSIFAQKHYPCYVLCSSYVFGSLLQPTVKNGICLI